MLNRSKLYAAGLLAAAFAAGTAVGGAASAAWGDRAQTKETRTERRRDRDYTAHLQEELDLTAQQRDSVERILESYQAAMGELWQEVRPRMATMRSEVREHITALLDEDQQQRFMEHNERVDSARAARSRKGSEQK